MTNIYKLEQFKTNIVDNYNCGFMLKKCQADR